ncbi:TRAP transporter small permease [Chloroflexota bacterium]
MLRKIIRILSAITSALELISASFGVVIVLAMMGITFISVVLRYLFNQPISWTEFVLGYMLAWSIFLLMGSVTRKDDHIRMSFVIERLFGENKARKISTTVENVFGLGISAFFFFHGYRWVLNSYRAGLAEWTSAGFTYPVWIVRIVAPIGLGLVTLFYLERCIKQIARLIAARKRQTPLEPEADKKVIAV